MTLDDLSGLMCARRFQETSKEGADNMIHDICEAASMDTKARVRDSRAVHGKVRRILVQGNQALPGKPIQVHSRASRALPGTPLPRLLPARSKTIMAVIYPHGGGSFLYATTATESRWIEGWGPAATRQKLGRDSH
jgi:hypothetical protein